MFYVSLKKNEGQECTVYKKAEVKGPTYSGVSVVIKTLHSCCLGRKNEAKLKNEMSLVSLFIFYFYYHLLPFIAPVSVYVVVFHCCI